jgi:hypothetical protein
MFRRARKKLPRLDVSYSGRGQPTQGVIGRWGGQRCYRRKRADEDSAEYKMIMRQMEGIRRGSELGGLLMQEYDMGGMSAVNHW